MASNEIRSLTGSSCFLVSIVAHRIEQIVATCIIFAFERYHRLIDERPQELFKTEDLEFAETANFLDPLLGAAPGKDREASEQRLPNRLLGDSTSFLLTQTSSE